MARILLFIGARQNTHIKIPKHEEEKHEKEKVEKRYKEKRTEWDKYGWLRWSVKNSKKFCRKQKPKSHKNYPWRDDSRYIQRARAAYGMEAEEDCHLLHA